MTAIAGLIDKDQNIWMGGDSAGTTADGHLELRAEPKVFVRTDSKRNKFLIGFTSSFRMGQLLNYTLKIPNRPRNMDILQYMSTMFVDAVRECFREGGYGRNDGGSEQGGTFLVGYKKRLFVIESDFQVGEPLQRYAAVGSGHDLCKGSLFTTDRWGDSEKRIITALEAATAFNSGVRGPFLVMSI